MNRLIFFLLIGLVGTAILVSLGIWQMQRLGWKEGILAEIDARSQADAVALPADPRPERDRYLAVQTKGTFLPGEVHVLVSKKQIGAGYRVISLFLTDGGQRVMVDRGFVREGDKDAVRRLGPANVIGNLHWPRETDRFTPEPDTGRNIRFARDVEAMARALDADPILIVARAETDPGVIPMPVDTADIPNDHLQYAITWFSLAGIWVAMTVFFLWRARARNSG